MTESGMPRLLTVSRASANGTAVVSAVGEIDITSVAQLREVLGEVLAAAEAPVIDLSGVRFIGSVGLNVLLEAAEKISPKRLRLVVSPQVRRPIEITGLHELLLLSDTLDEALAR
ncbi:STAS domain-containing protein [Nocardia sp. CDC153]|uniref:STAS domain-containing protein n=1 Tax=Nocardia sp. CDC153 TaxID=3112167 RepID=UPI002DB9E136|nr:STAS domain-containing protein [Nocardia sp. CDC153]MEC3952041.1 STAS domain-containing protein [Nocardia sp. CDC153]